MTLLPPSRFVLAAGTPLYRVQSSVPRPTSVIIGPVLLPPTGGLAGRVELPAHPVAAFALDADTAVYETVARAMARVVSLSMLAGRDLLSAKTATPLTLLDARPHANPWPFLTAARYVTTQAEADHAFGTSRLDGIVYWSAQQHGGECVALFDSAIAKLAPTATAALVSPSGGLHRLVAAALTGSQLPLVP